MNTQGFHMKHIPDVLLIAGAACLSYGAWLVYEPAGFVVGGLLLTAAGIVTSKASK